MARTAAEVTAPKEIARIAAAYKPGEFGYEQVEKKFGLKATVVSQQSEVTGTGIWITNYEKIEHFESLIGSQYGAAAPGFTHRRTLLVGTRFAPPPG